MTKRPLNISPHKPRDGNAGKLLLSSLLVVALIPGCAAITNPVANGIPVRILPDELLAETREGYVQTPLTLLRQQPPEIYRLAKGDILGVYIEGVLGSADVPPPVNVSESVELQPSIGYPIPVRADGTITLPLVGPLRVEGLTIEEAEDKVIEAFTAPRDGAEEGVAEENAAANAEQPPVDAENADAPEEDVNEGLLRAEDSQILVTLMRPRHIRVLVIREDSPQQQVSLRNESLIGLGTTQTTVGGGARGIGEVLELPAYENDVLNVLARTGGLPGLESTQEVVVQRGYWDQARDPNGATAMSTITCEPGEGDGRFPGQRMSRIPLRMRPGEPLSFGPQDIVLQNGDIVTVRGRQPEFFYTGGLLPAGEYPLPNDYDLTVLEAVLKARGPLFNGGFNASNLNGSIIDVGLGNPSPNLLAVIRQTPHGGQVTIRVDLDEAARDPRQNLLVQAGDVLILQESPDQAVARYISEVFRIDLFTRFLDRGDATGTTSLSLP